MKSKKKEVNKKKAYSIAAAAVVAVMFIPMLYSIIYLGAFWDAYGKMDDVPVAFVNMDKPVTKDGKEYKIGSDVEKDLKDNDKVKWEFVSYDQAKKGVEGASYYAMVVIPEDFSKKISESQDGKFDKPEIIFEANKGRNYIFSQISTRVADGIKTEISSKLAEETSKTFVENLYDVKSSLKDADNGAGDLLDGTNKLKDGSNDLSNGLVQAKDGSTQLKSGLIDAANGEKQITSGVDSLIGGLNQLKNGLSKTDDRIPQLVEGAAQLSDKASQLKDGVSQNSTVFSQKMNQAADGVKQVSDYVNNADALINASAADLQSGKITAQDIKNLMTVKAILDGVKAQNIETNISSPLRAASGSMQPIVDNLTKLQAGAAVVAGGTSELAKGIASSSKDAVNGVNQLLAGANQLKTGSSQISSGLDTAASKTGDLADGISKLSSGAIDLKNGLGDAADGSSKLKNGLNDGYNKMNDKLKFTAEDMSKFIKEPTTVNDKSINDVKFYGEGLAPYFISLSLWLGAMFVNLIISIAKFAQIVKNKFLRSFTGKFVAGAVLTIIQALILSLSLMKGLHIDTVNPVYFYMDNIFIAVVFFSVMYGLSSAIGVMATPVIFVALLVQLASCGGTFPIETAPAIYRTVGKYLPMTYSVKLVRMITSGMNAVLFKQNILVMVEFALVFLLIGIAIGTTVKFIKKKAESAGTVETA